MWMYRQEIETSHDSDPLESSSMPPLSRLHMKRHDAYFEFSAESHYEMGLQMGAAFSVRAAQALSHWSSRPDWDARLERSAAMLVSAQEHFPDLVSELEGYAKGAGVPFASLWALSVESDADEIQGASDRCTTVVTNGGDLVAHNEDYDPTSDSVVALVRRTIAGRTMLDLFYYNTLGGNGASVSSEGYVHCVNSLTPSDRALEGIPRNVIARWLSMTSDPLGDFEKLKSLPRASGFSHTLVGREEVYNIEWSQSGATIEQPGLPFVHANNYIGPLSGVDSNDNSTASRERYSSACRLSRGEMSQEELEAALSDSSGGPGSSLFNERTVARVIFALRRDAAFVWLRSEAEKGWIEYPLNLAPRAAGAGPA